MDVICVARQVEGREISDDRDGFAQVEEMHFYLRLFHHTSYVA